MADRYWVLGTGDWDASDTTHWAATSGGSGGETVPGASDTVTFDGSSGGGTVTITAGVTVTSITVGAFTGTLNTNGQTVTTSGTFSISGSGARTITLGSSTINCNNWNAQTVTNLTFNSGTSTIASTPTGNNLFGGLTYNIFTITTGASVGLTTVGSGIFATLTITGTTSKTGSISFSDNITVTGTFTVNGNSVTNRILLKSSIPGTARTITVNTTVTATNADFQDITGAGTASWDLSGITGNSGDCGGNSGITFTTPATQTATGTVSFTWSTHGWTSRVPLPQDDVVINNAFSAAQTITMDMSRLGKSINFTGTTGDPIFSTSNLTFSNFGSVTLIAAMSISGSGTWIFEGRAPVVITSNTQPFTNLNLTVQTAGTTCTLADDFSNTGTKAFQLRAGTFDTANNDVTVSVFSSNVTTALRTLTMGNGTWTIFGTGTIWNVSATNITINPGNSTIKITDTTNATTLFTITGSLAWHNLWYARGASTAANTLAGNNTFSEFKSTGTAAHSFLFTAATTQTIATFTVSGSSGNEVTIDSTTTATHTLVKSGGGTVSSDYLNIQHSVATPANTWYAGANSTDNQAVATAGSGWVFTVAPVTQGSFLGFML